MKAVMWRNLMDIGMRMHAMAKPTAPSPSRTISIPSTLSTRPGEIDLHFYLPKTYDTSDGRRYPFILNFHGGGFTIGHATDDARWARAVVEYADAVVVSVEYRLAPEHPFPTAIEDGVDAALYCIDHADELRIDSHRVAFSGFSAGGNMSFSVPIRLAEEYRLRRESSQSISYREGTVVAIAAWYPSLDYTKTREERRKTNVRQDKDLPKFFTNLFDASYLPNNRGVDLSSPWLSPGIAPDPMIKQLPENIILYTCEWDELQAEGEKFYRRLVDVFDKKVVYKTITGVCHAFDKTPNPFHWDQKIEKMYRDACRELRTVFYGYPGDDVIGEPVSAEEDEVGKYGEVDTRIEVVELSKDAESGVRR
ncbi:hypothetical protein E1B28_013124 [Marasmius oreades]|uniref:Alpha/beta hydrolase fold-3 domain-containing protein n=1 Tax=Marasmius oreades TaxID=181124 RepID=A0A9P7RP34_9AGAR|nr:uncharacterized protein E1B28_013124 [Marasmius oreades]KAG7087144.1 hypothetical protein E1B28_013124 [Marasmius oreades]